MFARIFGLVIALTLCTVALPAHAQDAGPADMAQVSPDMAQAPAAAQPSTSDDLADGAAIIQKAIGAGTARDWRALGAAVIMFLVFLMRAVVGRWVGWFKTDRGGAVMALVIGVLGTVASLLGAGGHFSWGLITDGLMAAFTAAGGYATMKKLFSPSDAPAAAPKPAV